MHIFWLKSSKWFTILLIPQFAMGIHDSFKISRIWLAYVVLTGAFIVAWILASISVSLFSRRKAFITALLAYLCVGITHIAMSYWMNVYLCNDEEKEQKQIAQTVLKQMTEDFGAFYFFQGMAVQPFFPIRMSIPIFLVPTLVISFT